MTITEFLEARIAEDEAEAQKGGYHNASGVFARDNYGCLLIQPTRVLAECAAKRAIMALHENYIDGFTGPIGECVVCEPGGWEHMSPTPESTYPCQTVKALASVYKDHPDYRQEWAL